MPHFLTSFLSKLDTSSATIERDISGLVKTATSATATSRRRNSPGRRGGKSASVTPAGSTAPLSPLRWSAARHPSTDGPQSATLRSRGSASAAEDDLTGVDHVHDQLCPSASHTSHDSITPPISRQPSRSPSFSRAHRDQRRRENEKDQSSPQSEHHLLPHIFSGPISTIMPIFGRSFKESHAPAPATLEWQMESSPAVFYGDADTSSGALVSGQLFLDVTEPGLEIESFTGTVKMRTTQKKPFQTHCTDCGSQYLELKKWSFLQNPLAMTKGTHSFPFSVLLEGHLPASMDGPLSAVAYIFRAEAMPRQGSPIKLEKTVDVKRSIPTSDVPHHSIRVFPPTNIKANLHYSQVIHPGGQNTMNLRLDGVARVNDRVDTIEYWKLKKLTWRIDESSTTSSPACTKHTPASAQSSAPQPNVTRNHKRNIGGGTLYSGWKSCYGGPSDSSVEFDFDYFLTKWTNKFTCDTKPSTRDLQAAAAAAATSTGGGPPSTTTSVSHQLMVEMIVSQEWAPVGKPDMVTQTGIGRVLRMHFVTVLTERGGVGISWDNEAPPIYQDVPASPPAYDGSPAPEDAVDAMDTAGRSVMSGSGSNTTPGTQQPRQEQQEPHGRISPSGEGPRLSIIGHPPGERNGQLLTSPAGQSPTGEQVGRSGF